MYQESLALDQVLSTPDRRRHERRPVRGMRHDSDRVQMLGYAIDLIRPEEVMLHMEHCIEAGQRSIIGNHNLHSLYLTPRTPGMDRIYEMADIIQLDSTPLVYFGKLLGYPIQPMHRSTYLDWREHFWSLANRKGWRIFYLGGAEGVVEAAQQALSARYPGAVIGGRSGYFDAGHGSQDNQAVLDLIHEFSPDVLFVGMGMPRQEQWIADNISDLPVCPILPVGAAFDYEAGVQKAAPRWMGAVGLEWLFRLVADPKRLFSRYCVEPWFLIKPALKDLKAARQRKKTRDQDQAATMSSA